MCKRILLFLILALISLTSCTTDCEVALHDGDILFQDFPSPQSEAVKLATQSEFSHCGMVFFDKGQPMVWEAVQPVCITPLEEWIARDTARHWVAKRIIGADTLLTASILARMKTSGRSHMGKDYDIYFDWSDEQLYCSEFVWKVYREALGIDLVALRPMGDYDFSHPVVREIMKKRWGESFPEDEPVVAPEDLYQSELLETVFQE